MMSRVRLLNAMAGHGRNAPMGLGWRVWAGIALMLQAVLLAQPVTADPVLPPLQQNAELSPGESGALGIRPPLTASVRRTLYLPSGMCGQWSVTGILQKTNVPQSNPVSNNLWILANENDHVTIMNPENGASASVEVQEVQGDTATFVRNEHYSGLNVSETVTLTLQGDRFTGMNLIKRSAMVHGKPTATQYALFQLEGRRIEPSRRSSKRNQNPS